MLKDMRVAWLIGCATLACMVLALPSTAAAVQSSGSLAVLPDQSVLTVGQNEAETIRIFNASSDTLPVGINDVPATLFGTTTVTLACTDSGCTMPLPGTLTFVNCTNLAPGVCSCGLDLIDLTGNTVDIIMCPGGVAIPAGGSVDLATVNSTATTPAPGSGAFFTRGATGPTDIQACSSADEMDCATSGAAGSSGILFRGPTPSPTPSPTPLPLPTMSPPATISLVLILGIVALLSFSGIWARERLRAAATSDNQPTPH